MNFNSRLIFWGRRENKMFKKWDENCMEIPDSVIGLRDLIIDCLRHAHHTEMIKLTENGTDAEIYEMANNTVSTCFQLCNKNFYDPTVEDLYEVIESLASRSEAWNVPTDVIDKNKEKVRVIIKRYEQG